MKTYSIIEIWETVKSNLPFTITLLTLIFTCLNWSITNYKKYKELKKFVDILPAVNPGLTKEVIKIQKNIKNIETKINILDLGTSYNKKNISDINNKIQKINYNVDKTSSIQSFLVETVYFHLIDFYKIENLNRQDYIRLIDILDKAMIVYKGNKGLVIIKEQLENLYKNTNKKR